MKRVIISLRDIVKIFRVKTENVVVLKKVSVEILECSFTIIFGPSGCGKSTLLHIVLGLEKPTSGSFSFFEDDLYSHPEDYRSEFRKSNVGMVYQQPNWIKSLTVVENIAFAGLLVGMDKIKAIAAAHKVLSLVGMDKWADYIPTELSSGQQQKVSLARALVSDPKVIIADEPTGNLDYQSGVDLMKLFDSLVKNGKTIIMVTHDINIIQHASNVIQMFDGNIVNMFDMSQADLKATKQTLIDQQFSAQPTDTNLLSSSASPLIKKRGHFSGIKSLYNLIKNIPQAGLQVVSFMGTLTLYGLRVLFEKLSQARLLPGFVRQFFAQLMKSLMALLVVPIDSSSIPSITRIDLIDLSMKNMMSKKTRTLITISGMTLGIGLIVFLVSIGYGLEKLVISRVARLEETRQIDAIPAIASNVKINDKSLATFKNIPGIKKVLPVIGVVGKINYKNSKTDVALYGVMAEYLVESATNPTYGRVFKQVSGINKSEISKEENVAGVSIDKNYSIGDEISRAEFSINPDSYVRVRSKPSTSGEFVGFARRQEGTMQGKLVLGDTYGGAVNTDFSAKTNNGMPLALWLKSTFQLYSQTQCPSSGPPEGKACTEGFLYEQLKEETGKQKHVDGYIAKLEVNILKKLPLSDESEDVLGISFDENGLSASTAAALTGSTGDSDKNSFLLTADEMKDLLPQSAQDKTKIVKIAAGTTTKEAIINKALAEVIGIQSLADAVGKQIKLSFEVTGDLAGSEKKIVSSEIEYTIVGVTTEDASPMVYVPIADVRALGLQSYSQVKLVTSDADILATVRKQVEALGYKTSSVVDTIHQIEQLFSSVRTVLGLLGIVALSVAALGMFNTLTVSLLERTHEIGMMKAIGMKSTEVQDLFLTESMIMGFLGGIGGLFVGFIGGKFVSVALSTFTMLKGQGTIDVAHIPTLFIIAIIGLSLIVGIATGIYPARRATKISALDALRYE